tara:strand:- start:36 stop:1295 length:1260 start_codon:yes stop_codon:yes gene_type:complete
MFLDLKRLSHLNIMNHRLKELLYSTNNYNPINKIITKGKGIYVYDKYGNKYIDCISGYSALNQGHSHPRLINVVKKQIENLTLTSRAYSNDKLGMYSEKLCKTFGYDKVLLMNGGVESGESAIKIARKWGYNKKRIKPNKAINLFFNNNFWGRSIAACSSSTDPSCYEGFGPYTKGLRTVPYNDITKLHKFLETNPTTVSVMLEPIQGEGGIIIPDNGYLRMVRELCDRYNVLMILDEVQTGLGRTGKLLACDYEKVKPDILCLGKSLSGGFYPISATLANEDIMNVITPGTHGSTFGGNPLACTIGMEALDIIFDEKLIENSKKMGAYFRQVLQNFNCDIVVDVRGKGLLNAIEFENEHQAILFTNILLSQNVITKSTKGHIIRVTPPLTINQEQIELLINKIKYALKKTEFNKYYRN